MDLLADFDDEPVTELVPARLDALQELHDIENELLDANAKVLRDVARFRDIDIQNDVVPPPQSIVDMGEEEAWKAFRMARAAWINAKEAPVGIKIAAQVTMGVLKNKAMTKSNSRPFNVQVVVMTSPDAPEPKFPELEVKNEW